MATPSSPSARFELVTGPPGSGRSHAALERVRRAATTVGVGGRGAAQAGGALLLLPTYGEAQHALRTALTRWDARGLFDEVFVTFTSAGERFLPGFRVRSLPSAEERDRLLVEALRRVGAPVFAAVAHTRGLRARLLRLLKDVKQGAEPAAEACARLAARAHLLPRGPRERLVAALQVFEVYGGLLEQARLEDHEDLLHRLLVALRSSARGFAPALLAVDGFDDMTPVEAEILAALVERMRAAGGEMLVTLPRDDARPGLYASAAALAARLKGLGFVERGLTGFARAPGGSLAHLAAGLFTEAPTRCAPDDQVQALRAADAEDEADLVAREVRALLETAGRPDALVRSARDVLVVVPDLQRRGPRLLAALARLGVPARSLGASALASEPWVRAAAGVLPVLGGRSGPGEWDAAALLAALRYRALTGDARVPLSAVDEQDLAWRTRGLPSAFSQACEGAQSGLLPALDALKAWAGRLAAPTAEPARALMAALDDLVPVPAPGGLGPDARPRDPARDGQVVFAKAARQRLATLARDRAFAAERVGLALSAGALAAEVLDALPEAAFAAPDRRLDVVHVLDPQQARSWEAAVVVVAGLDEDGLPRRAAEDPLLGDEERERLAAEAGVALSTTAAHQARERRLLLSLFTRARRRLLLVRAARTPEGEELPPSPVLAALGQVVPLTERVESAGPAPGVPSLARARTRSDLARLAAAAPGAQATASERALLGALRARLLPALGARAARWRRAAADPLTPEALARCVAAVERMSASRLSAALACPQQHFLARVAGVPGDQAPLSGPRWGARDLGSALHEALRLALLHPGQTPEDVAARALGPETLVGVAARAVVQEVARAVRLFRQREAALAGPFVPALTWLERRLGRTQGVPMGSGAGAFLLEGQIDRLDLHGREALVVDYKLGHRAPDDHAKATAAGEDVQLPLYALAVEREAGYEVVGLEWVSASRRARALLARATAGPALAARAEHFTQRLLAPEAFRAQLEAAEALASDLVARLRQGEHGLDPRDEEVCKRCDVREACRPDRAALRRLRARAAASKASTPGAAPSGADA